mmetsp:Transcript_38079/g.84819  ORF Transcript_38079/g.84819 Transcript_38079/m.84819 type:complete len:350 (-) Transcript_38079:868-1917(-)
MLLDDGLHKGEGKQGEPHDKGKAKPELAGICVLGVDDGPNHCSHEVGDGHDHPGSIHMLQVLAGGQPITHPVEGDEEAGGGTNPEQHLGKFVAVAVDQVGKQHSGDKGHHKGVAPQVALPLLGHLVGEGDELDGIQDQPHHKEEGGTQGDGIGDRGRGIQGLPGGGKLPGAGTTGHAHVHEEVGDLDVLDDVEVLLGLVVGLSLVLVVNAQGVVRVQAVLHVALSRALVQALVHVLPSVLHLVLDACENGVHGLGQNSKLDHEAEEEAAKAEADEPLQGGGGTQGTCKSQANPDQLPLVHFHQVKEGRHGGEHDTAKGGKLLGGTCNELGLASKSIHDCHAHCGQAAQG